MTIEEAIEYLDYHFYSDDGIADHDAVKAYETVKAFVTNQNENCLKLKVPDHCGKCESIRLWPYNSKTVLFTYCGMSKYGDCPETDVKACEVDPRTRPDWCPIVKTNETLDQMPAEKRKQFDSIARGLRAIFGDDKLFDQT